MNQLRFILILALNLFWLVSPAHAAEDVDWVIEKIPLHEAGPESPIIGARWSLGSRRDDVLFIIHFDAKTDMSHGIWYGEIRAPEKFYVTFQLVHDDSIPRNFKVDNAQARGPDAAAFGGWKEGASTVPHQSMTFGIDRERLSALTSTKSLIVKYTLFDNQEAVKFIEFPLATIGARLAEIDADIQATGGGVYLKTKAELEAMPFEQLPDFMVAPLLEDLNAISTKTGRPLNELRGLSINEITQINQSADKVADEARLAERRARHQEIYDQEPEWMDLNLCPKPDVIFCSNVGGEAYSDDIWGDFTYGEIKGVVWRPVGSIVHIYAGMVELDHDPKIVYAEEGAYYYIIKTPKGYLDLRQADGMLIR